MQGLCRIAIAVVNKSFDRGVTQTIPSLVVKLHSTKCMTLEEGESNAPHLIPSRPIIDIYIDNFAVQNSFADAVSWIGLPLLTTMCRQPLLMRLECIAHAHLVVAFYSLRIIGSHGQCTLDLAPASEHSVTVSAPAPEAPDARFSALGFPQDNTTVEVDIRN